MAFVDDRMFRAVRLTRWLAGISLVASAVISVMALASTGDAKPADSAQVLGLLKGVGLLYVLPGALLFILAWRMDQGEPWAYVATMTISAVLLARLIVATLVYWVGGVHVSDDPWFCEVVTRVPCVYLMVACLNAFQSVREIYRIRRRDARMNADRGFEPVMHAQPGSAEPKPTPARLPPRPTGLSKPRGR